MISIPTFMVREGSRVYGDTAHMDKVAFDVSIEPANVLGALAGGYVANRVQTKMISNRQQEATEEAQKAQRIENNYYDQVSNVLANLKIVFTPINVIFSVNGQVFEIISSEEMTPEMRRAFLQKDAGYFRDVLVKKMNMEMQLAEQAFTQRLLAQQGTFKEASAMVKKDYLIKLAEEEFELLKTAAEHGLDTIGPISVPVNFDALRPFNRSEDFFREATFNKVAGPFDYFKHDQPEVLTFEDLQNQINVGFLPDRVLFLHNGQLLEQIPLLGMNDAGYDAFRRRDKQFFLEFFNRKVSDIAANIAAQASKDEIEKVDKEAADAGEVIDKEAASLEEMVEEIGELNPVAREHLDWFRDPDIHPVMYDKILTDKYGDDWHNLEIEAVMKQIEIDFNLGDSGIGSIAFNKILALYALLGEDTALFDTSLAFEKFIRAMNDKEIDFTEFQGYLELSEILFALEIVKSFKSEDVVGAFHITLPEYVSEELFTDNIRFVSPQLFDENNPWEKVFFDSVNGFLMRKWKEKDFHGLTDELAIKESKRFTEAIRETGDTVLAKYADEIELSNVYRSTADLLEKEGFLANFNEDSKAQMATCVVSNIAIQVATAFYLEMRRQELEILAGRWEKEVNGDVRA